jgi:flagellar biosynthesis/type III secretory pathway chaperone
VSGRRQQLLEEMATVLDQERDAVRTLDVTRMEALSERKLVLAEQLAAEPQQVASRAERALAIRVRSSAYANRLLLEDVKASIARRVDTTPEPTVYDARARRITATRVGGRTSL